MYKLIPMAKRSWILGYLTLTMLVLGSLTGSLYLGWYGLELYLGETSREITKASDFVNQSENLDAALLSWSFATLLLLITFVSFFALMKSLIDDISRAQRGPIDAETWEFENPSKKNSTQP
jgi:hypothetical protein